MVTAACSRPCCRLSRTRLCWAAETFITGTQVNDYADLWLTVFGTVLAFLWKTEYFVYGTSRQTNSFGWNAVYAKNKGKQLVVFL